MHSDERHKPEVEAVKAAVQEQIIECLNRFYAMETGMWGKPLDALIVRTVLQGKLQGKLYDLSALSGVLDLPVSTLHRKIGALVAGGYLQREARGKSIYISPSYKTCITLDKSFEDMMATLRQLYQGDIPLDRGP